MRLEKDIKTIFIDNEKPIFWCKQCHGTDVIYNLSFSEVLLIIIIFFLIIHTIYYLIPNVTKNIL